MGTYSYGGIGKILKIVVRNQHVPSHAKNKHIVRKCISIVQESVIPYASMRRKHIGGDNGTVVLPGFIAAEYDTRSPVENNSLTPYSTEMTGGNHCGICNDRMEIKQG